MKKSSYGKVIIILLIVVISLSSVPLLFAGIFLWDYSFNRENTDVMPGVSVEYPTKILADNDSYDFEFTISRQYPYSLTVLIPSELSVDNIFPPTALVDSGVNARGETVLVLNRDIDTLDILPHVTITQTIKPLQPDTEVGIMTATVINDIALLDYEIPPLIDDRITLSLSNSGLFDASLSKYKPVNIAIFSKAYEQEEVITTHVENVNRALWREYLSHYFRIFAAPVLGALFGILLVTEFERRKNEDAERNRLRENHLQGISEEIKNFKDLLRRTYKDDDSKDVNRKLFETYKTIIKLNEKIKEDPPVNYNQSMKYNHLIGDIDHITRVYDLIEEAVIGDITPAELSKDAETWLGAMYLAIQRNQEQLKHNVNFRRLVRLFPSDLLTEESDWERYEKLRDKMKLLPTDDRKHWTRFAVQIEKAPTDARLADLQLFPPKKLDWRQMARAEQEKKWLFSVPGFFYPHPLRRDIIKSEGPIVVVGEPGSGRTALAMDLTRYPSEEDVLSAYFTRTPSQGEVHRELVAQLLRFSTKRPTYLGLLRHAELNLLAELLNEVLGKAYVLSEIEKAEAEFRKALIKVSEATEKIKCHDSLIQLRILKTKVSRSSVLGRFSDVARVIQTIARSLEFRNIRIGLDIDLKRPPSDQQLETLLGWGQGPVTDMPVEVIFFVPDLDDPWQQKIEKWSMGNLVLEWKKDHLKKMLLRRARLLGLRKDIFIPSYLPTIDLLIDMAKGSPRKLAQMWRYIVQQYPDEKQVTQDMIQEAGEVINV